MRGRRSKVTIAKLFVSPLRSFQVPSNKLVGKDRVAVIAKQLNDYLQTYNRETELYYSNAASANQVPDSRFRSFLRSASQTDVEEILFLHMKSSKCCHSFLGRCCSPSFTNLKFHSLLQVLPQLCAYNPSKVSGFVVVVVVCCL